MTRRRSPLAGSGKVISVRRSATLRGIIPARELTTPRVHFDLSRTRTLRQTGAMHLFIALLIGCVSGIVAALCGVGGGVVMVPAFVYFFKMGQKVAVATSLAAIVLTAIATTFKNHSNGFIDWKIALCAGAAGGLIGWRAADLLKQLSDVILVRIFATVIIVFGVQMWVQSFQKGNLSQPVQPTVFDENQKN